MLAILAVHAILEIDLIYEADGWTELVVYDLLPFSLWFVRIAILVMVLRSVTWYVDFLDREVMPFINGRGLKIPVFFTYLFFVVSPKTEELKDDIIRSHEDDHDRLLSGLCEKYKVEPRRMNVIRSNWLRIYKPEKRTTFLMSLEHRLARHKRDEERPVTPPPPLRTAEIWTPRQVKIKSLERETAACTAPQARYARGRAMAETNERERLRLLGEAMIAQRTFDADQEKLPAFVKPDPAHAKKK